MNATMKKNFVIAGNTIAEVEADLRALKAMVASGMTSGCGGQTAQAALEAQSAMRQVHGWAPGGVMVEAADPKSVSPAPTMESILSQLLLILGVNSGTAQPLSISDGEGLLSPLMLHEIAYDMEDSASEEDDWEDDWEDEVADTVHEEIDDLVEIIQNTASEYDNHEEMARTLVNCATELLNIALREATAEMSRGEALDDMMRIMDELCENLDTCE